MSLKKIYIFGYKEPTATLAAIQANIRMLTKRIQNMVGISLVWYLTNTKLDLMIALDEKLKLLKEDIKSAPNLIGIHPIVFETFYLLTQMST